MNTTARYQSYFDRHPLSSVQAEAVVDLRVLRENLSWLQQLVEPAKIFMVLKGNAHGHGTAASVDVARSLGIEDFAPLTVRAALELRNTGVSGRLICWQYWDDALLREAVTADVELSISSEEQLRAVQRAARFAGRQTAVHVKVDTGLRRAGATSEQLRQLLPLVAAAQKRREIRVVGLWSHLANTSLADDRDALQAFLAAAEQAEGHGISGFERHLAASIATIRMPEGRFERVRLGLSCFGLSEENTPLRPAMTLLAPVLQLMPSDDLSQATRALLGIGYAQGLLPGAAGKASVLLGGFSCRILAVGPESTVVELPLPAQPPKPGAHPKSMVLREAPNSPLPEAWADHALIFGSGRFGEPTAHEWAAATETTADDIISRVPADMRRHYIS